MPQHLGEPASGPFGLRAFEDGKARHRDQQREQAHPGADRQIRPLNGCGLRGAIGRELLGREMRQLLRAMLDAREDESAADDGADDRADTVKALREVQPRRRGARVAEDRDIGVRRGLQKGEAEGDDIERAEEPGETLHLRGRIEEERPRRIEREPEQHHPLVAEAPDQQARRNRRAEIADIESELDQARLGPGQVERLLELPDQHVVERRRERPGKEQRGDEREGAQISPFDDRRRGRPIFARCHLHQPLSCTGSPLFRGASRLCQI